MKWEYQVITFDKFLYSIEGLTTEEKFNQYGKDGWEFVGLLKRPHASLGNPPKLDSDILIFKRAIAE